MNSNLPKSNKWILLLVFVVISLVVSGLILNSVTGGKAFNSITKSSVKNNTDNSIDTASVSLVYDMAAQTVSIYMTTGLEIAGSELNILVPEEVTKVELVKQMEFEDSFVQTTDAGDTYLTSFMGPSVGAKKLDNSLIAVIKLEGLTTQPALLINPESSHVVSETGNKVLVSVQE